MEWLAALIVGFAVGIVIALVWAIRRPSANGVRAPHRFDRNLIVIGGGSAGLSAAFVAGKAKAKVTLVEANEMGGDCLNTGCVPSKALIKSARVAAAMRDAGRYGLKPSEPQLDFTEVMARVKSVIADIAPHDSEKTFEGYGVDVRRGYARFVDPWTVEIEPNDEGAKYRLTARGFLLATGSEPVVPSIDGIDDSDYLTSETLWDAMAARETIPARFVIVGGGPIGCELAQSFQRLGSQVTIVERDGRILAKEVADAATLVHEALERDGVRILTGHDAARFERDGDTRRLISEGPDGTIDLPYDAVLIGVGRKARLAGYGLEKIGIKTGRLIETDDYLRTSLPHIFAAGDVAGPFQFTHAAGYQGVQAVYGALFSPLYKAKAADPVMPRATYTEPEVASVGLNEDAAEEKGVAYEVTDFPIADVERAVAESASTGFVRVLTEPGKDRILGATIVATNAGEMLTSYTFAMTHGLGLKKLMDVIYPYPGWSEATKLAAQDYTLKRLSKKLTAFTERYLRWVRG